MSPNTGTKKLIKSRNQAARSQDYLARKSSALATEMIGSDDARSTPNFCCEGNIKSSAMCSWVKMVRMLGSFDSSIMLGLMENCSVPVKSFLPLVPDAKRVVAQMSQRPRSCLATETDRP